MAELETENQWQYLESRPQSWRKQLYLKGQNIKASDIYSEMIISEETPEEAAENWNLPLAAIQEVIEYCKAHQELLKREAQEEHRRLTKIRGIRNTTYKIIALILIVFFTAVLAIVFLDLARFVIIGIIFIFFLRTVNQIPFLGDIWKWFFGERKLWDWFKLLLIPLAVTYIGVYFTVSFTERQADVNVEKARYEVTQNFLNTFQKENILEDVKKEVEDAKKLDPKLIEKLKTGQIVCQDFIFPKTTLLKNQTLSVLEQLTNLKTSKSSKLIEKKHIIEFLNSARLIKKGESYLNIAKADMSSSDLRRVNLEQACLDSVEFTAIDRSPTSRSDMRRANLKNSILKGALLEGVNLRYANLENADLRNSASLKEADLRGANLSGAKIDKTTVLKGAIYNTEPIKVPQRKERKIYNLLCRDFWSNYLKFPRYCLDPIDYETLKPTKLPNFCESKDKCTDLNSLNEEQLKKKFDLKLNLNNEFPILDPLWK